MAASAVAGLVIAHSVGSARGEVDALALEGVLQSLRAIASALVFTLGISALA